MFKFQKTSVIALGVALSVAAASAQTAPVGPRVDVSQTVESLTISGKALIRGRVIDASEAPIPGAKLRLRNLTTSKVEQNGVADDLGEFEFIVSPDVPYVVELVDSEGRTIVVGDVLTSQVGDIAAAVISLPARAPAAGIWTDSAAAILSAVAGMGLVAVETARLPPVSPER